MPWVVPRSCPRPHHGRPSACPWPYVIALPWPAGDPPRWGRLPAPRNVHCLRFGGPRDVNDRLT
jgi:hypothetical protein